jgi:hypothetical protein
MMTLTILSTLYSIFGLMRFKKLYGNYDIFDQDPKLWLMLLVIAISNSFAMGIYYTLTYLP